MSRSSISSLQLSSAMDSTIHDPLISPVANDVETPGNAYPLEPVSLVI